MAAFRGCDADEDELGIGNLELNSFPVPAGGAVQRSCVQAGGCGSRGTCGGSRDCGATTGCSGTDGPLPPEGKQKIQDARLSRGTCVKCKEAVAEVVANQREPMCRGCLRNSLLWKFKSAVNKHDLISRHDKVLLAFSGGHCSRAALEFLLAIRSLATTDAAAAADRGRIVFQLGVTFVDERAATGAPDAEATRALEQIQAICQLASPGAVSVPLHVASLEDAFLAAPELDRGRSGDGAAAQSLAGEWEQGGGGGGHGVGLGLVPEQPVGGGHVADSGGEGLDKGEKLGALLAGVKDPTGREDLVEYLRMQVLQQVAQAHGYTKLVLGLCTSRVAVRVISATVKGRGFALPADLQCYDARWRVPVVLPLRDCVARELAMYCHLAGLRTACVRQLGTRAGARRSINALTDEFVTALQEENSSRESTILRTAAKLEPFPFNRGRAPADSPLQERLRASVPTSAAPAPKYERGWGSRPSERGRPGLQGRPAGEVPLCSICQAPLTSDEVAREVNGIHSAEQGRNGRQEARCGGGDCCRDGAGGGEEAEASGDSWRAHSARREPGDLASTPPGNASLPAGESAAARKERRPGVHQTGTGLGSAFGSSCCNSCRFQILGADPADGEVRGHLDALLPDAMRQRGAEGAERRREWARSFIGEYILEEDGES